MLNRIKKELFYKDNKEIFTFDTDYLKNLALDHKVTFKDAKPFPHVIIDNFLPLNIADRIESSFPEKDHECWLDWTKRDTIHQPKKQGIGNACRLENVDPTIQNALFCFNSYPFINFIELLTGIDGILPDPHFHGGGLHQILPGGVLDVHIDFNYVEKIKMYRMTNSILYLNKNWKKEYGGNLELWDRDFKSCQKEVEPLFNRLVVFITDRYSYHGHPKPLACPEHMTRKSIASYHYAVTPYESQEDMHPTTWTDIVG